MIHPTAIIHPKARLETSVRVGPYAVIDEHVEVGRGCVIGPHVYLTGQTVIAEENQFYAGCVIGEAPQDLKYGGELTGVRMGKGNIFREHVTVHRSSKTGEETVMGEENFLMANAHVGHNCEIGNGVIIANGAALGGYVRADDRAFISANCVIHQFCRVGTLAMMQGGSSGSMDLPPYMMMHRTNELCGLNVVGMRRAGLTSEERLQIRRLYHAIFRSGTNLRQAVAEARKVTWSTPAIKLLEFLETTKRGICVDPSRRRQPEPEE